MQNTKHLRAVDCIAVVIFGGYLLAGSFYTFLTAKWFPGFPVQLDISMLFGDSIGVYLESTLALIVGTIFIAAGSLIWMKRYRRNP